MSNPYLLKRAKDDHGRQAEKKLAKRINARLTPASGAMVGAKGDMSLDNFLIECKSTINASLSVKKEWLDKISKEALDKAKAPALAVQFVDSSGNILSGGSWMLVRESDFRELFFSESQESVLDQRTTDKGSTA